MTKGRLVLPVFVLTVAAALALAACGGGESAEDKITSAIETAATGTEASICTEAETAAFVEQVNAGQGKEALKECEEEAARGTHQAESVEVSKVEVQGEEARATVAFTGGTLDGQTLIVGLIEEEGAWKLNEAVEFVNFDREKLVAAFKKGLGEEKKVEPALAECVIAGLEEISDSELKALVLGESQPVLEIAEECSK